MNQTQLEQQKEIVHLRRSLKIAQEERDMLKKAAIFFAEQK